ncbi:MAG: dihydrofolate reductase [Cyclobacteriaceae bacterium]|nr:dihydrofolate reductase [Cyclobacteriaceae bacterium]
MVSSLDGFIAKKDGDISWMNTTDRYENGVTLTQEYIDEFLKSIDCYVMGSKTYEHALELGWVYGDVPVFVLSSRNLSSERTTVQFYSGDLSKLVNEQLKLQYKNIWMVGGSVLTKELLKLNLADEIVTTIVPVLLGEGSLFFDFIGKELPLLLKDSKAYKNGMVELTYAVKK